MDLSPFLGFLAATAIGTILAGATLILARRTPGLTSAQALLVSTLEKNSDALAERVTLLESQVAEATREHERLRAEIDRLRQTVTDLATENAALRKRLKMEPRA